MSAKRMKMAFVVVLAMFLFGTLTNEALAQQGKVSQKGKVTIYTVPEQQRESAVDFKNAIPMPMPAISRPLSGMRERGVAPKRQGKPGFVPGAVGNGKTNPETLPRSESSVSAVTGNGITPGAYGLLEFPFTTSRVDITARRESKSYPYRAAGKLFFKDGDTSYVCSASLIQRGVIVTAAHCVAAFGESRFFSNWVFVPAQTTSPTTGDPIAPFAKWGWSAVVLMTSYLDGSDTCHPDAPGVVCENDVAVIRLAPKMFHGYPGTKTGWFGYGWDGYGFNSSQEVLINQLGYPVTHDGGYMMQRTDSQGFVDVEAPYPVVWGTSQTGGASGGPQVVNLGIQPELSETDLGFDSDPNIVVSVTSWGYIDHAYKVEGASAFTSTNILPMMEYACDGQSSGACKP